MHDVYITAWRADNDLGSNLMAMAQLWRALPALDRLDADLMVGAYNGELEQSIRLRRVQGVELLADIAAGFKQESVLVVDSTTHEARLVYCDRKLPDTHLGKMQQIPWQQALVRGASWSYDGAVYLRAAPVEDVECSAAG